MTRPPPYGPDPEWFRRSRAHVNGLRGRRRQHVIEYTGDAHEVVNAWLRSLKSGSAKRKPNPAAEARVKTLDAVLAVNPLTRTTVLTRTIDLAAFGLRRGDELAKLVGVPRVERGFLSTSRYPDGRETKDYRNPVRLTVIVPSGTPAAAIESISRVPGQGEILLGHDLWYVLLRPTYDARENIWRAVMRITSGKEAD